MEPKKPTERHGTGQSGYTAGRVPGDPSIGIDDRNAAYPKTDERAPDGGDDDRFTGRGRRALTPDEPAPDEPAPAKDRSE